MSTDLSQKGAKQEYPCPYFVQENFRGLGTRQEKGEASLVDFV